VARDLHKALARKAVDDETTIRRLTEQYVTEGLERDRKRGKEKNR
jgi:hypothetical protein